ncbi:MAG: DUF362 domain-containing protein [Deltaproteobacteria bacterium]|nr:MAG: DUF362 domain-containing protein [Deltaproteobacteria bacterium]
MVEGLPKGASAEAIARSVREIALATIDFSWLKKGDTVIIKPVCNSGNAYPATTSPIAVKATARLLREKGAGRVIVCDKAGVESVRQRVGGVEGSTRELMKKNGLMQAAFDGEAEVICYEEMGWDAYYSEAPAQGSHWKEYVFLPNILRQADHVVLLPRVGRHIVAGSTLGLKAAVGWIRDDSRGQLHRDAGSFYEKIAEINNLPSLENKLRLVLTVATKVLATFGPDDGYTAEPATGLVFASKSLVAHDMIALAWLLWVRRYATPKRSLHPIFDPYETSPNLLNRIFVGWKWGLKEMRGAERLEKSELNTIWDDPVLRRAMEIFGGVPKVQLKDLKKTIPQGLMDFFQSSLRLTL